MPGIKKYRSHARSKTSQSPWQRAGLGAIVGAGLILLGIALGSVVFNQAPAERTLSVIPAPVNFPAPELTLARLDGENESLVDYLGQVVLVNNWATWCPPCKAEMPEFQAYYAAHKDEGFTIVAISAADQEADVRTFVQQNQLSFPVWLDPQNLALAAFRNQSLPNSYVVDRKGVVRLAWTGGITRDILETHLTPLLEEK
jgi:peroxiredoxin